jgi:GT2 family glycosyltransferase
MNHVSADPLVSILIVTYTQHARFARCFESLATATRDFATETIVVVNGVPLQPEHRAAAERGATVVHAPANLGLPGGLHYARAYARGRYLAVLQDDVEVDAGWLEPLVAVLEGDASVGAAGSRSTLIDGTPHSDGMVIAREADAWLLDPEPRHNRHWAVDACFSSSCLVRAEAWDSVGGPNHRLYPLQFVDIDLGLRLNRADWSVTIARDSSVRHLRHGSTSPWMRRYLVQRNRRMVERDHAEYLRDHPEDYYEHADVTARLTRLEEQAEVRGAATAPHRARRPPISLDRLVRDARSDARRIGFFYPLFRMRSAIGYRLRVVRRFARRLVPLRPHR